MVIEDAERRLEEVRLPEVGRVVPAEGVVPRLVLDATGKPVEPIQRFLADFVARGNRVGSVRSGSVALGDPAAGRALASVRSERSGELGERGGKTGRRCWPTPPGSPVTHRATGGSWMRPT
jgi:hypothetical protein